MLGHQANSAIPAPSSFEGTAASTDRKDETRIEGFLGGLAHLSLREAIVAQLHFVEEFADDQIAVAMGISCPEAILLVRNVRTKLAATTRHA